MVLDPSSSSSLEHLALKGLINVNQTRNQPTISGAVLELRGPVPLSSNTGPLDAVKMGLEGAGFRPYSLVRVWSVFSAYFCPNEIQ